LAQVQAPGNDGFELADQFETGHRGVQKLVGSVRQSADRHFHLSVLLGQQANAQLLYIHDNSTENFLAGDKFNDLAWFHPHVINNPPHESQLTEPKGEF
jgi:hypothetical protein